MFPNGNYVYNKIYIQCKDMKNICNKQIISL